MPPALDAPGAGSARGFLFRVGKEGYSEALARAGAKPMVMNGRTFAGYVRVDPAKCDARALRRWVDRAIRYVRTLPAKRGIQRKNSARRKRRE